MTDRRPVVLVRPGRHYPEYIAWCYETGCEWAYANSGKAYVQELARGHREEHRQKAERGRM